MESDEDPLLVKYLISSLEFEKLKYYEARCRELTSELEQLKLHNSKQVGSGNFIVPADSLNKIETSALKEEIDPEKPLINYSVPLKKNDDNDDYDESALLHLIPEKDELKAKFLLKQIEDRGSELTWNSSGVVFIDNISIPNSNIFIIYPHLFQKSMPKRKIAGLIETIKKLELMGFGNLFTVRCSTNADELSNSTDLLHGEGASRGLKSDENEATDVSLDQKLSYEFWWYLG